MNRDYTKAQLTMLVLLRLSIGWHFLYEGVVKISNPDWSALGFLMDSKGIFEGMFKAMAASPSIVNIVNILNVWGLILIGASLLVGLFSRPALIAGIALLALYYISHPPLIGAQYLLPSEGSYLVVNKNLIELLAMGVLLVFPTSKLIGLDRMIFFKKTN
ncbi:MAG: DoxX family membrane protein [Bacteroidales bacterium]